MIEKILLIQVHLIHYQQLKRKMSRKWIQEKSYVEGKLREFWNDWGFEIEIGNSRDGKSLDP